MRRRWVVLLPVVLLPHMLDQAVSRAGASSGWKPVTQQELKMSAADVGDPEADAAILFREGELNDNSADGTSLKVYIRVKIFNDRGRRYADVQLPYRVELGKINDVHARTIRPDGTAIDVEGRDIFDKLVLKTSHGIWRAKAFTMPRVEAGSIIEYRYRQTYPAGFRYFALDLQSELFIKQLRYSIRPQASSKRDVRWVSFNTKDARRFSPVWNGAYNIAVDNIPPFKREPMMPPEETVKMWGWLYYADEIETNPDKYWREYARRAHERDGYDTKPTRVIRRVVSTITLPADGPQEKLARIYSYVQSEIQNIGFREQREGETESEIKRNETPEQTLRRRYGTPREINRLFVSMLRAAGFDARVAEVTTRDESFFHRSFGDSFQFNSEITAVVARDGSVQFYDPGTAYLPVGMLSWDKEAVTTLLYLRGEARFMETPVTEALRNVEERNLEVSVFPDGRVDAKVDTRTEGQRAVELRSELSGLADAEQRKRVVDAIRRLLPLATSDESSVRVSNLTNAAQPLTQSYGFTFPQFAARTEKRLILRPGLLSHPDESVLAAPSRINSIYFHFPWSENERVVLNPPEGYLLEPLPDPIAADIGAARYRAGFRRQGQCVVYERHLLVNAINFTAEQYPTVKAFFDRVHQGDELALSYRQF